MRPNTQLAAFLAKFDPAVARQARTALAGVRAQLPGATELVYDNYNALAIGFGASERASDAFMSVAVYPRWVSIFFFPGVGLPDPDKLLAGSGSTVRHVKLRDGVTIDAPAVSALVAAAHARAKTAVDPHARRRVVIKSISARQKSRRPAAGAAKRGHTT
jgi:Domain of unknown function (DU1801)